MSGFNVNFGNAFFRKTCFSAPSENVKGGQNVARTEAPSSTNGITPANLTTGGELSSTTEISSRIKLNSPEANGLASPQEIGQGMLVDGYHFDNLDCDMKAFNRYYSYANTPQIAKGTKEGCSNIEYAGIAGNVEYSQENGVLGIIDKMTV